MKIMKIWNKISFLLFISIMSANYTLLSQSKKLKVNKKPTSSIDVSSEIIVSFSQSGNIEFSIDKLSAKSGKILIYNIMGKQIYKEKFKKKKKFSIPFKKNHAGPYILKIKSAGGNFTKKFQKEKEENKTN